MTSPGDTAASLTPTPPASARHLPSGVRPIAVLRAHDKLSLGQEAGELGELVQAGLPFAPGWIVRLGARESDERLTRVLGWALERASAARVRPLLRSHRAAERFEARIGSLADVTSAEQIPAWVRGFNESLREPELRGMLEGGPGNMHLRIVACDPEEGGKAASTDPIYGEPDALWVTPFRAPLSPWRFDRRTMRSIVRGGELSDEPTAARAADLADRAQLVLGRPVELEWCTFEGEPLLLGLRPLSFTPSFPSGPWKRVAPVYPQDTATMAPLSVDCLQKAFFQGAEDCRVRRIYGRPYCEVRPEAAGFQAHRPMSLARAAAKLAWVARDIAAPVSAARKFERRVQAQLSTYDALRLQSLDDEALTLALRERHAWTADAVWLLERSREAALTVRAALEAVIGPLPSGSFRALARPQPPRSRRRAEEQLARLGRAIEEEHGDLARFGSVSPPIRRRWEQLKESLSDMRVLGSDVRPQAFGESDACMLEAMRQAMRGDRPRIDSERRDARRRILSAARARALGHSRETMAASVLLLLGRVSRARGRVIEMLSALNLRLRRAACEAGRRLVDAGVLETEEDVLYLHLNEIEEALLGEPGAYGARARRRREDDERWARYRPPRHIRKRASTR